MSFVQDGLQQKVRLQPPPSSFLVSRHTPRCCCCRKHELLRLTQLFQNHRTRSPARRNGRSLAERLPKDMQTIPRRNGRNTPTTTIRNNSQRTQLHTDQNRKLTTGHIRNIDHDPTSSRARILLQDYRTHIYLLGSFDGRIRRFGIRGIPHVPGRASSGISPRESNGPMLARSQREHDVRIFRIWDDSTGLRTFAFALLDPGHPRFSLGRGK